MGQIFLTNRFLGGEFMRYGIEVVQFLDQDPETRIDPMARVFPRLTKCVFHKYGSSGKNSIYLPVWPGGFSRRQCRNIRVEL